MQISQSTVNSIDNFDFFKQNSELSFGKTMIRLEFFR